MAERQQNLFQPELFTTAAEPWDVDEADDATVATVVFAEPPHGPFDYRVPDALRGKVEPGRRVRVPLGRGGRLVVGYCVDAEPLARDSHVREARSLKEIATVIDARPLFSPSMMRVARWIANYYLCELGVVLEAVVPAGVRAQAGMRESILLSASPEATVAAGGQKLSPQQAAALRFLIAARQPLTPQQLAAAAKCTLGPINALREKKLVREERRHLITPPPEQKPPPREAAIPLNADQKPALATILAAVDAARHETVVIHGVTGSGKTEVYIQAIEHVVRFGRQAIVLVPEISLTPQTQQRFRSRFDHVAVLHSHLGDAERHWHWQRIARGEVQVVVGARSAIFAPTPHLGLIVLDEEHDASFKQNEAPRYHARDVAVQRATLESVPLVLGSATPSLESWHLAKTGKYRLVEMPRRVSDRPLPDVQTIDLRTEYQSRSSRGAVSRPLHMAIQQALNEGGQIILLLNRRGFSTNIQCPACGFVARCPDCDLALTHHREGEKAVCHYCDYQVVAPPRCPECQFEGIRYSGIGTQKLEAEIRARFSGVPVLRMDTDTMQRPGSHEAAFAKFRSGEVKILLGTQMIAKGLDFPNVTLVGVVNADTALHFPDFRAAERTFQLVTQVAGRTGRGPKGGRVLVQTFSPDHPAILAAVKHDYGKFAAEEMPTRRQFGYPPVASMIRFVVRGPTPTPVEQFATQLSDQLRAALTRLAVTARILGPAPCPIAKLRGKCRFHILAQSANGDGLRQAAREATSDIKPPPNVQWIVDIDPVDML